ncbi:MAG: hypothetical protein F6J89_10685 [Symploca sp. SIO1C4]|uniref:DUF2808 domain-containing protein n=1 Tax=Symploca sp. SIO1C4 TaxID=2607765 RepID=A0A6B3NAY5_9CYAN|nr:hypothetical protein [Symploca sp. SIO1C4]NET06910.1 hypothetical protein [Symploca sp. SIO2B6]
MFDRVAAIGIAATLLSLALSVKAQPNCTPLNVVGGEGTEVKKTSSPPTIPVPLPGPFSTSIRHNWNTDWAVPGGQVFQKFVVTIVPHETGNYNIEVYLKYPDETADEIYDQNDVPLSVNQPLTLTAEPRSKMQPYQVNIEVGGLNAVDDTYTASVVGCR